MYMDSSFFTKDKHHLKVIAKSLQDVFEGVVTKLAISLPPRAGKSYIVSLFCAWCIGKDNGEESIMRNSYSADLANKFSYDVRDIIQKDNFLKVFPEVKLKFDKRALEGWSTTGAKDMTYFCAGVGGPITGKGAKKLAILDDPIKNIEEALSPAVLENIWNWYTSTHLSRLESGCREIQIATRWSKRDVIGRLTDPDNETYSSDWKVIVVPAMIDGKSFCEEIKTTEEYIEMKRVTEDFIWEAEYMQQPFEVKGLLFPSTELNRFSLEELKSKEADGIIGATDPADSGTDYLSGLIGKRIGDYTYITDVIYTQDNVDITEPKLAQTIIDTKCQLMVIESNSAGKSFARNVRNLLKSKFCSCKIFDKLNTTNKETRILMASGYVKSNFYFRNDYMVGSDYDKFMRALTSYVKMGKNKNDDAPDSTTILAQYMQENFRKTKEKPLDERIKYGGKYFRTELKMKGFRNHEIKKMEKNNMIEVIGE
jgi:predicted phage terminase large subunit-like protein